MENELLGAVHVLQALTPATLQETIDMAQKSLGHDSTIDFGLVDADAGAQLRLDLTWNREYAVSRPVSIDLGEGQEVVGAEASGELKLDASGIVKLRLLLPLTAAAMLEPVDNTRVDEGFSEVAFNVAVAAEDAHIGASVGPVSLFLGTEDEPGSLHAGFGVRATGTTGEDTPSIADFFSSGFDIGMTNGGADCEEDAQVLCATFPTFVAGSSAGDLTVTSTLGDGDDLTEVFTGTSTVIGIPDSLKGLIEGKPFEFDTLAEGLKQYLFYAETSLRVASNNGEMPVVGKDLQAGADFMGDTREKIDVFLEENGDPTTVGGARALLTTKLAEELDIVVNGATGVQVDFTCRALLEPPAAPRWYAEPAPPRRTTILLPLPGRLHLQGRQERPARLAPVGAECGRGERRGHLDHPVQHRDVGSGRCGDRLQGAPRIKVTGTDDVGVHPGRHDRGRDHGDIRGQDRDGNAMYPVTTKAYTRARRACPVRTTPRCRDRGRDPRAGTRPGRGLRHARLRWTARPAASCAGGKLPVDLGLPGLSLQDRRRRLGQRQGRLGPRRQDRDESQHGLLHRHQERGQRVRGRRRAEAGLGPRTRPLGAAVDHQCRRGEAGAHQARVRRPLRHRHLDDATTGTTRPHPGGAGARVKVADTVKVSVDAKVDIDWHLDAKADAALPGIATDFRLTWAWGKSTWNAPAARPHQAHQHGRTGHPVQQRDPERG